MEIPFQWPQKTIAFDEGLTRYFPNGLHDAYITRLEIRFSDRNILMVLEMPDNNLQEVFLISSDVNDMILDGKFKDLTDSTDIYSFVVEKNNSIVKITGSGNWEMFFKYGELCWLDLPIL